METFTVINRIRNQERFHQSVEYDGLMIDTCSPTDINGFLEYRNKAYVVMEFKFKDTPVPRGQLVAFERDCDDREKAGKHALMIVASHNVEDCKQNIRAANTIVTNWRFKGKWHNNQKGYTTQWIFDKFFSWVKDGGASPQEFVLAVVGVPEPDNSSDFEFDEMIQDWAKGKR